MQKVLSRENIKWIPYKNLVEFYTCRELPAFDAPVTTVHGFFFKGEKLLLVRHKRRGWEVPGGHIHEGESYGEAMRRELAEEAQMHCDTLSPLGFLKKIALEDKPENCLYPHPLSYCIFYSAEISDINKFTGDKSIIEARFFTLEEASQAAWIDEYRCYFDEFLKRNELS